MLIAVDGNEANVKEKVGVSIYSFNLLHYFKKKANNQLKFLILLKENPKETMPKSNNFFRYEVVKGSFFWSQLFLPVHLFLKKDIDIFFSPAHYLPRFIKIPSVVTVHDLSYFYYPDDFLPSDLYKLKNWTKYSVYKAKKVIAVSKTTKKDLMKFYQLPDEKIEVIYNGYEKNLITQPPKNKNWIKDKNYILYVGTLQPRKNITILIDAFYQFIKSYPEFKLIIAGKKGWLFETIFQKVEKLKLKNKIIFTHYVSDQKLVSLYQNAFCFVLPSFYEGFGIPILEAMSFGCPVISSFASSLPEIGADACLYFDPKNSEDLYNKLILLKENQDLRNNLIAKGRKRVKFFSWEKCARETLEVIKSVSFYDKSH